MDLQGTVFDDRYVFFVTTINRSFSIENSINEWITHHLQILIKISLNRNVCPLYNVFILYKLILPPMCGSLCIHRLIKFLRFQFHFFCTIKKHWLYSFPLLPSPKCVMNSNKYRDGWTLALSKNDIPPGICFLGITYFSD